jgi:ryanodine receptor 2
LKYIPNPIDTSNIELSNDIMQLCEKLAKNTHEVWAEGRLEQGWSYGEKRDDENKKHPCLVPYEELSEDEKKYDRNTAMETLKLMIKLGFRVGKKHE